MFKKLLTLIKQSRGWLLFYFLILAVYACFSFGLTTPNLTLIQAGWFQNFQFWMWNHFFNNRILLVRVYISLIGLLFISYGVTVYKLRNIRVKPSHKIFLLFFLCLPLLFSYNALSADVFNYIFNAKMVVEYQANPHVQTALDFESDLWVRFMHNIHTPAPYGYGWTLLSLPMYLLGMGKFILTWLSFRVFSFLSLILAAISLEWLHRLLYKKPLKFGDWALLFLNPLLLIEIVSNSHNDLWMMVPTVVSFGLLLSLKKSPASKSNLNQAGRLILSLLLMGLSISTKLASVMLIPIWLLLALNVFEIFSNHPWFKKLYHRWPLLASILMFLPLFSLRSQQFHPWYLSWSLIWLPLIKQKYARQLLLVFSAASLLRYVPFLRVNDYNQTIIFRQKLITWSAPVWLGLINAGLFVKNKLQKQY